MNTVLRHCLNLRFYFRFKTIKNQRLHALLFVTRAQFHVRLSVRELFASNVNERLLNLLLSRLLVLRKLVVELMRLDTNVSWGKGNKSIDGNLELLKKMLMGMRHMAID